MEKRYYKFKVLSHRTGKEIKFNNNMEFPSITEEMARGICLGIRIATGRNVDIKVEVDGKVHNW